MNLEVGLIHLFRHKTTPDVPSTEVHCFLSHFGCVNAVVERIRKSDQPAPKMSVTISMAQLIVMVGRLTIQYSRLSRTKKWNEIWKEAQRCGWWVHVGGVWMPRHAGLNGPMLRPVFLDRSERSVPQRVKI